jgi:hypothetical protein
MRLPKHHFRIGFDGELRGKGLQRTGMTVDRLMRESTDRVERALRSDDAVEQLVATRIVETPDSFRRWEGEHVTLMRGVAEYSVLRTQLTALKHTTLSLIHGKALFDYLKRREIRGEERANLIRHFYPNRGYTYAMVAAHGSYVRKTCSFLCTNHVGADVARDDNFIDPLAHYEELYAQYFHLYCKVQLPHDVESASEASLLPLLKHQLNEWRWAILNPREAAPRVRRESEIRSPTGDTQSMRTIKWTPKR